MIDQCALLRQLYPLRRDLISDGFDEALEILAQHAPLHVHRFPSGTSCWTWTVPKKWSCREAYVETIDGRRVIDQRNNPLHVASYSRSMDELVTNEELHAHLHMHPLQPEEAPFIFYYYQDNWGFGCSKAVKESLRDAQYHVVIDSTHDDGQLKVAEWLLPGESADGLVLCAHLDHPAQVNDGLSGVVTGLAVMESLAQKRRQYTYRLLITAETIGSVAWLSQHEALFPTIKGGLFLEMTGLAQPPALQLSYAGDTEVDRCFRLAHLSADANAWVAPYRHLVGNDERQFNAPGVRIPMLSYARALPWGHPDRPYKEYHSAADNMDITHAASLEKSKQTVLEMIELWENNCYPVNQFRGEVFLSGYDLAVDRNMDVLAHRNMLRIMDWVDGKHTTAGIAERLNLPFAEVNRFVRKLEAVGLVTCQREGS